jgi:hypothetical protein
MSLSSIEQITFFGSQLINFGGLGELILRLAINLFFMIIIVRWVFYPIYRDRNYLFTFSLINLSVFLVCILLSSIKLKIGFAFGLFAVFSIIRYRTEQIPTRQMTYLFVVIIVAVINALSTKKVSYAELLFTNSVIAASVYLFETNFFNKADVVKTIQYERIDLIKPENHHLLIEDLQVRTGFVISRFEIDSINFLNDSAKIRIFYHETTKNEESTA